MACNECDDGDGGCIYPMYGVGPHVCFYKIEGAVLGESKPIDRDKWPANFIEYDECKQDAHSPACGIYTHCLNCGDGEKNYDIKKEVILPDA